MDSVPKNIPRHSQVVVSFLLLCLTSSVTIEELNCSELSLKGGQSNRRHLARVSFKYLFKERIIENIGLRDFINQRVLNFL